MQRLARYDFANGKAAYQVDIDLTIDGQRAGTARTYWWVVSAYVQCLFAWIERSLVRVCGQRQSVSLA